MQRGLFLAYGALTCLGLLSTVSCRRVARSDERKASPHGFRLSVRPKGTLTHRDEAGVPTCAQFEIHYSPEEDLEQIDFDLLAGAKSYIDISAYSFTDRDIANALEARAASGVRVRVYSDRASARSELRRATGIEAIIAELSKTPNIEVRVKRSSNLAHLKSYEVDGTVLRTGSANFSARAETRQDNDLIIIRSSSVIKEFDQKFNEMWSRPDNERIEAEQM